MSSKETEEVEDITYLPLIQKNLISNTVVYKNGFIRVHPSKQVFPKCFKDHMQRIREFTVHPDDVWISSFPKCGTTWTQEMVWCLRNKLDFDRAKRTSLALRVPFFELYAICPPEAMSDELGDTMAFTEALPRPRIIKTHLALEILPENLMQKGAKIIYVTRNPRDACVSFYHHWRLLESYTGTFAEFVELFIGDVCGYYTPFIAHVLAYWHIRHLPNVCFISFEDMKKDLASVINKVAAFLGVDCSQEQIPSLVDHLSFKNMKTNETVNKDDFAKEMNEKIREVCATAEDASVNSKFMRKGIIGDWKENFDAEMLEKFIQWENNGLKGTDLSFVYE